MPNAVDLSIIIPCYMEADTIASTLQRLSEYLAQHDYGAVEVLVVVADSSDDTATVARSQTGLFKDLKVIESGPRQGKGYQVRLGMFEARGKYRVFMDADLATPLKHLEDVKRLAGEGAQVGIAVRDLIKIHPGFVRKSITGFGNVLAQLILLPGIKDTQCGFKFFEAKAAQDIFGRMTILGWGFDLEILAVARSLGYRIATFDAPDWHDPKAAEAGLVGDSAASAALRVFHDLLIVRWNLVRGLYRKPLYTHESV